MYAIIFEILVCIEIAAALLVGIACVTVLKISVAGTVVKSYCGGSNGICTSSVNITGLSVFPTVLANVTPFTIADIIPEILLKTAIVYVLSRASAEIGPLALIVVVRNSAPSTTVSAGTKI
jgi:hypothetical protein